MSNRVEELESKVAELQAAVNGLTEELVETKERVRLLEEAVEVDLAAGSRPVGYESEEVDDDPTGDATDAADADSETETVVDDPLQESTAQAESRREASAQHTDDADFIDADAGDQLPSEATDADGDKGDEADGDDEAASEDDDIIVA